MTEPRAIRPRRLPRLRGAAVCALGLACAALLGGCLTARQAAAPAFASDRIRVQAQGQGPDVVLLAGLGANAAHVWGDTMRRVPGYRYHVVQVRGMGGEPAAANGGDGPVVAPVASEVVRYIRTRHLRQPRLVGLSMGGTLALKVAEEAPGAVGGVMVVDMLPFLGAVFGPAGTVRDPAAIQPMADRMLAAAGTETADHRRGRMTAQVELMAHAPAVRAWLVEDGMASDPGVMARAMHELMLLDLRPGLERIRGPLHVLYVHAPLIPWSLVDTEAAYRDAYAAAPQALLRRVPDSYHFVMLDQPERFDAALRAFLSAPDGVR